VANLRLIQADHQPILELLKFKDGIHTQFLAIFQDDARLYCKLNAQNKANEARKIPKEP
jgi:hypothetical protein